MTWYATFTVWWLWAHPAPVVSIEPGVTIGPCAARTDVAPLVLEWSPAAGFTAAAQVQTHLEECK